MSAVGYRSEASLGDDAPTYVFGQVRVAGEQEGLGLRVVQGTHGEAVDVAAGAQGLPGRTDCREHAHTGSGDPAGHEGQDVGAGVVQPLGVVDDGDQRLFLCSEQEQ
jgi:hypothetical protein